MAFSSRPHLEHDIPPARTLPHLEYTPNRLTNWTLNLRQSKGSLGCGERRQGDQREDGAGWHLRNMGRAAAVSGRPSSPIEQGRQMDTV